MEQESQVFSEEGNEFVISFGNPPKKRWILCRFRHKNGVFRISDFLQESAESTLKSGIRIPDDL